MPRTTMKLSYTAIRNYAERWSWEQDGVKRQGINVPEGATHVQRVPFYVKYITSNGTVEEGMVVCLKVFPESHQRMIQFVESREIRRIRDYLIIEIDGHQFMTH